MEVANNIILILFLVEVANNIMLILVFMEVTRNIVIILLLGKSILTTFFRVGCVAILETYMKILK